MYLLLPSILQTPRQTHRCTNMYDSSPRHSTSFHQISTLKPYPIKSYTQFLVILLTTPYQTQSAPLVASALATSCTPPSTPNYGQILYKTILEPFKHIYHQDY